MSSTELLGGCAPSGNRLSSSGIWYQSVAQSSGVNANSNISDVFGRTSSEAASALIGLRAIFAESGGWKFLRLWFFPTASQSSRDAAKAITCVLSCRSVRGIL
jgi:hypothetical protein